MDLDFMSRFALALRNIPSERALEIDGDIYFCESGYSNNGNSPILFSLSDWWSDMSETGYCGYTACAIGWMTVLMPDSPIQIIEGWPSLNSVPVDELRGVGWPAVTEGLGLTIEAAYSLFSEIGYNDRSDVSPVEVAEKIERFLSEAGSYEDFVGLVTGASYRDYNESIEGQHL